jgi:hypothetical protein
MSIISRDKSKNSVDDQFTLLAPDQKSKDSLMTPSPYRPSKEEAEVRSMILDHFRLGYATQYRPRVEFNDLCLIDRMQIDQMAFNAYQPNNGEPNEADVVNAWKSNAFRPVVRNKCISIAAHATARLIFPKVFAHNESSDEQTDAAQVMEDLMEVAGEQSNYEWTELRRTIAAMTDPISLGYTEFAEVYREVKRPTGEKGKYTKEVILDETLSGFQDTVVPCDELFIENFYEPDIQKQGWLLWRRVISYSLAEAKYRNTYSNFKDFVRPGMQIVYNDANQSFYQVYDTQMRPYNVEEIVYWNRSLDLKIIMVNGVMLTPHDNPNPRIDKLYPWDGFGYELINNRCFYHKSLAFKMQQDANIINTLYPMIVDGTYLSMMPPLINVGMEAVGSDVMVPGVITTFRDPNQRVTPILGNVNNLKAGMDTLFKVDESINMSSQDPIESGGQNPGNSTAYEISRLEQNAATVLGLFIKMRSKHIKDYGTLRMGDILQYWTIADVTEIEDDPKLIYKTFLLPNKTENGKVQTRKIKFSSDMSNEPKTEREHLNESYSVLKQEKDKDALYLVNPELFRNLKYRCVISPDILNPKSTDLERAFDLELYDRMIANPQADQEEAYRLLLSTNPKTKKNPDKYVSKNPQTNLMEEDPTANNRKSPLAAVSGKTSLPQL